MDTFNKKSLFFFFLTITLLASSSSADRFPQARGMEERELVALHAFGGFTKAFSKKLGELGTRAKWSKSSAEKGFNVGIQVGDVYNRVAQLCTENNNCTPANSAQHPLCGGMCVYKMAATTGKIAQCVKYCSKQEERRAIPQLKRCHYYVADGRITCK